MIKAHRIHARYLAALCLLLSSAAASADFSVLELTLTERTRVSRTAFDYSYAVAIENSGPAADGVIGLVTSTASNVTVLDGELEFGAVAAGGQVSSNNRLRIRVDRISLLPADALEFKFQRVDPSPTDPTILEAESTLGASVIDDIPGFTGTGFVALTADTPVRFNVEVPDGASGVYQFELRYALPEGIAETELQLRVDNLSVGGDVDLKPNPALGRWATKTLYKSLQPGQYEISVVGLDVAEVALLDHLRFSMTPPDQDRFLSFPIRNNHVSLRGSNANTNAYYATIDPTGERNTFAKFLTANDMNNFDETSTSSAHATYQNIADLNLGRDMYVKRLPNGNVASYVQNYASAEDALTKTNLIATVAMEYRAPDNQPDSPPFTMFYVYDKDGNRINRIDLDGRGEKFVPALCNVCHGGKPKRHQGLVYQDEGDTNAKWILWDLNNFRYASAKPKSAQQGQFRKLNRLVLCTNTSSANTLLVRGWYGDNTANCDSVAANNFDGDFVPSGWAGHESLYLDVVAPSCRACHAQRGSYNVRGSVPLVRGPKDQSLEFNSFSTFNSYKNEIERMIYDEGIMPAAKVTYERFWRSSQPVILDNALYGGLAHQNPSQEKYPGIAKFDFGDRRKPGRPIAVIGGARLLAAGFPYDNYTNLDAVAGERARLNAGPSQFADTVGWFLQSGPTTPSIFPSTQRVTSFLPNSVSSNIAGAGTTPYIIRLSVTNSLASYNQIIQTQQWANSNRQPVVFTDNNPSTVDVYDLFVNSSNANGSSCFNCHSNNSVNTHADTIYNLRDTAFHANTDAARKRFAFDQAVTRVDCRNPEQSLLLAKPAGYHHNGGAINSFGFGQSNWEYLQRWVVEGAKFGNGTLGCPENLLVAPLPIGLLQGG